MPRQRKRRVKKQPKIRILKDKHGRPYVMMHKKKYFISEEVIKKGLSVNELVKWVIQHYTRKRKRRQKVAAKEKGPFRDTNALKTNIFAKLQEDVGPANYLKALQKQIPRQPTEEEVRAAEIKVKRDLDKKVKEAEKQKLIKAPGERENIQREYFDQRINELEKRLGEAVGEANEERHAKRAVHVEKEQQKEHAEKQIKEHEKEIEKQQAIIEEQTALEEERDIRREYERASEELETLIKEADTYRSSFSSTPTQKVGLQAIREYNKWANERGQGVLRTGAATWREEYKKIKNNEAYLDYIVKEKYGEYLRELKDYVRHVQLELIDATHKHDIIKGVVEHGLSPEDARIEAELQLETDLEQVPEFQQVVQERTESKRKDKAKQEEVVGSGADRPISNLQIDRFMKGVSGYLGTVASDQIDSLILPKVQSQSRGSFIMNLDPASKPGSHWVACYFDARPNGSKSVEYYNSFGEQPSASFKHQMKPIIKKLEAGSPLIFKVNKIQRQDNSTNTCGWFAMKFIMDRMRGKPFSNASGFDDSVQGEHDVNAFKKRMGGHFTYFNQDGEGVAEVAETVMSLEDKAEKAKKVYDAAKEIYEALPDIRTHASPAIRRLLEQKGNEKIIQVRVGRMPIKSWVAKVSNWITLGKFKENMKKLGYDKAFHLYMEIKLEDGSVYYIEKNHIPVIVKNKDNHFTVGKDQEFLDVGRPNNLTLAELIAKGEKQAPNAHDFWVYSAEKNNCQAFVEWLLKGAGLWGGEPAKFVRQDAMKILEGAPWAKHIMKEVTDFANKLDVLVHGRGNQRPKMPPPMPYKKALKMWEELKREKHEDPCKFCREEGRECILCRG